MHMITVFLEETDLAKNRRIVLASQSPRRRELLKMLGLEFEITVDNSPENADLTLPPNEVVCSLARNKCENVTKKLSPGSADIVIAADTVVSFSGKILGKPKDRADAFKMLAMLSGSMNTVYTGVCVKAPATGKTVCFYEKTDVFFKSLDTDEINAYINTGEPMDKAGAYGIQNYGALFIREIHGDYFNVVGLPLCHLGEVLKNGFDLEILL